LILPHRHPFRFVDGVDGVRAHLLLTHNSVLGREPAAWDAPWMAEAIAQAAALLLARRAEGTPPGRLVLAAVESAELRDRLAPGDALEIAVELVGRHGGLVRVRGELYRDDVAVGAATLILAAG
jgi:3-hydroxymyristoyl/3-hydroxydecanoyl-(acyl carrier protein) dehydratase